MAASRPLIVSALCALIATSIGACGGGGAPGVPGAASQRPAGGSAPAPLVVPTQTPPPPSKYLPNTWNGLFTMQVFDNHKNKYGISPEEAAADGPLYSALWGSNTPELVQAWRTNNPNLEISMYQIIGTDAAQNLFGNLGQTLAWWQANHPDWILYECDKTTVAFIPGVSSVPLDISNPDTVNYILNLVGGYTEVNGYSALGFDLVSLHNDTGSGAGHRGCGVITNSGWVQKFSGKTIDPQWASAMLSFLSTARTYLHGQPRTLAIWGNNVPGAFTFGDADETQVIGDLDVVLDESGFANYGKYSTDAYFNSTVQWGRYIQDQRKGFMDVNEWQEIQQLTNAEIGYALATYAMVKERAAVMFAAPYGQYGEEHYLPQYTTKIGPPCQEMYGGPSYLGLGRFAYYRQYKQALALVNTSPTESYTVKLPQHTYTDVVSGATVTSPLLLGPNSGYLLSISKIGCQGNVH